MRLNWKVLRLAIIPALLALTGCGGFSASQGVSPASFFLPGLIKADPSPAPTAPAAPVDEPGKEVAQF